MPVNATPPVSRIVIVKDTASRTATGLGEKNLLRLAPGRLVRVASAGSGLVTPFKVVTPLAGIAFVRFPLTFMVTLKVNVQRAPACRLAPLNEKESAPGLPERVPPQLPTDRLAGLAMNIPA